MNERIKAFLRLIEENPALPIVPMVDGEIVADNTDSRWMGSFGKASIRKYYLGDDGVYFYNEKCIEDCLNDASVIWLYDELDDEKALEVYRALPWVEAVIVEIDLPER